jgi:Fe-S cluster biogenesis protein NfuA
VVKQIEECIEKLERCSDPGTRETARQLVRALMAFHGEALAKIVELGSQSAGQSFVQSLASDTAVSQLLLLYGLHPVDLETRVLAALEKVRPRLQSHGGDVEFVSIAEGRVRLRLQGNCHGCPSSSLTMRNAIEEALVESAPDIGAIEVL